MAGVFERDQRRPRRWPRARGRSNRRRSVVRPHRADDLASRSDLIASRPGGADDAVKNDLPNELGVPNHNPDGAGEVDNHDVLTGSNAMGQLFEDNPQVTCDDWTKAEPDAA